MKEHELLRRLKRGDQLFFRHRDSCYVLRSEDNAVEQPIPHWIAESLRKKGVIESSLSRPYYTLYRLRRQ